MLQQSERLLKRCKFLVMRILGAMRATLIGRHAVAVLHETENGYLLIDPHDLFMGKVLAVGGSYEMDTVDVLLRYVNERSRVCFVGAHVGALLVPIARRVKEVVGIEGNPATFNLLEMNLQLNALTNAQVFNVLASDTEQPVDFCIDRTNTGGCRIGRATDDSLLRLRGQEVLSLTTRRVDDLCSDHTFDLVVMGIEGHEFNAMKGMPLILANCKCLMMEYVPSYAHGHGQVDVAELGDLMSRHFTSARIMGDPQSGILQADAFDALFAWVRESCSSYYGGRNVLFFKGSDEFGWK
jgi:FkbM family methyltransferase